MGRKIDYADEQEWLDEQEENCLKYLGSEGISIKGDPEIKWCVCPVVSLWESEGSGSHRIWVVSGDLPTDHMHDDADQDARAIMRSFCARWQDVSKALLRGVQHPTIKIGVRCSPEGLKSLGQLLKKRATTLGGWVENKSKWSEGL